MATKKLSAKKKVATKVVKKAPAKKATKKPVAKKAPAKKVVKKVVKKASPKKVTAKKPVAKKPVKKVAAKKPAVRKPAKKPVKKAAIKSPKVDQYGLESDDEFYGLYFAKSTDEGLVEVKPCTFSLMYWWKGLLGYPDMIEISRDSNTAMLQFESTFGGGDSGETELTEQDTLEIDHIIESIIKDEWPDLREGRGSNKTHMIWRSISQDVFQLDPQTPKQLALYSDIIKKSEEISESREMRIDRSEKHLPALFWVVIFLCLGTLMGVNTLFLPSDHFVFGLTILPIAFGGLISLLVITDRPFRGQNAITSSALGKVLASIKTRNI